MNLHSIVRGAIQSVNPDKLVTFLASTGNSSDAAGKQTPQYAAPVEIPVQIQPVTSKDLQHLNMLNLQGEFRAIYLNGSASPIVRLQQKGGDLFQFAAFAGAPVANWLTVQSGEAWNVDAGGWTRVLVQLQDDVLA